MIFAILTKLSRYLLCLPSGEGKEAGKREVLNSHEEKIREGQKRKTGEEKQHGKCLLHMSTRGVVSTTLLRRRTSGRGELEVSSSVHPDTFSTRQECWKKGQGEVTMSYKKALPHHSLCAIMVVKAGIAAAVLDYGLLKCLQFVHPTAAPK